GLISYVDFNTDFLKVAHCSNVDCSSFTTALPDPAPGYVPVRTTIIIGADGLGLIIYSTNSPCCLRVAHCVNVACTSVTTTATNSFSPLQTSLTTGADGLPLMVFISNGVQVMHCASPLCVSYQRNRR